MVIDLFEISEEQWDTLWNKGVLSEEDEDLADDWVKVYPEGAKDLKYTIKMYSKKLDKLRERTFMEFYGGGVVD